MIKKIAFAGVGLAMLASPLVVSAQTTNTSPNAALIAVLTQLVQILEQEIQQLLAAHSSSSSSATTQPKTNTTIDTQTATNASVLRANPQSGNAPLQVTFTINPTMANGTPTLISFGDDPTTLETLGIGRGNSCGDPNTNACGHTYTTPGTYTADVYDANIADVLGTATITVTGTPSATIDKNSLITTAPYPVITGTATQTGSVNVTVTDAAGNRKVSAFLSPDDSGAWTLSSDPRMSTEHYAPGTYNVQVFFNATLLTSGTLIVNSPSATVPQPMVTISEASITTQPNPPTKFYSETLALSGSASNLTPSLAGSNPKYSGQLDIEVVPASYTGPFDLPSIFGSGKIILHSVATPKNNQWSTNEVSNYFSNPLPAGIYTLLVYDYYGSSTPLIKSTVTAR